MLTLYRREQCELCDHAERALAEAGVPAYERVALGWDGPLAERYGERIPVLVRGDNGAELAWPFDSAAVRRFVGH
jgi:hypothetical protein